VAEAEDFEDAASLVDAAFGTPQDAAADDGAEGPAAEAAAGAAADADADTSADAEAAGGAAADADAAANTSADAEARGGADPDAAADTAADADADAAADTSADADAAASAADAQAPASGLTPPPKKPLTRGRLAAAAVVAAGIAAAGLFLLTGGASGNSSAPGDGSQTSVNPQAFYPFQSASPYETGAPSVLSDDALRAAVPGCAACKLVTRANGFSPDGAVLALFRTGDPQGGRANFKLVVVGPDGRLVWSAPEGIKALTSGIERFSTDASGNFYLALPAAKSGQMLVVLAWRDGKVQDIGGLLAPKVESDTMVGVSPQSTGPLATIVSQTTAGVPDADTGGLIESRYQVKNGAPVLVGCRRHVGESGQWIAFQPSADGCKHWPDGPVGPDDDDESP
jgi:hypothetical protein